MELVLTNEHLALARSVGACAEGLSYQPGARFDEINRDHVGWFAKEFPAQAAEVSRQLFPTLFGSVPLAILSGDGSGSGSGSGYGSGSGSGDGSGSGSGYGSGYGSGDGSGYGYGYGYGDGSGSGSGSGYGDGYGDG